MDGELAYWKALSGLGSGRSLADHQLSALQSATGKTGSIADLFAALYPVNGETDYWRARAGISSLSLSDAKYLALSAPAVSRGSWFRAELTTL